jgi:uncharacterized membrane protein YjjP (DUF1212 family)
MSNPHETKGASRVALIVFAILSASTIIEYIIAVALNLNLFFLAQIAAFKALFIVIYFMRIQRAFEPHEEEED